MARRLPSVGELSRLCISSQTQQFPALLSDYAINAATEASISRTGWQCRRSYAQLADLRKSPEEAAVQSSIRNDHSGSAAAASTPQQQSADSPTQTDPSEGSRQKYSGYDGSEGHSTQQSTSDQRTLQREPAFIPSDIPYPQDPPEQSPLQRYRDLLNRGTIHGSIPDGAPPTKPRVSAISLAGRRNPPNGARYNGRARFSPSQAGYTPAPQSSSTQQSHSSAPVPHPTSTPAQRTGRASATASPPRGEHLEPHKQQNRAQSEGRGQRRGSMGVSMSKEDITAFWNRKPSANTQRHEAFNAFQTAVYPPRSKQQQQDQQEEQQHRAPHVDTRAWRATPEFFSNSSNSTNSVPKQSSRETAYRQAASSIRPRQQQWPQQQWRDERRTVDRNVQRWGTSQGTSRPHVNTPPTEERAAMIQQQQRAQQVQREAIVQPKQDRQIQLEDGVTVRQLAMKLGVSLEEIEGALSDVGESLSPEDHVPQDAAELVAMELGHMVVFSSSARDMEADAVPRAPVVTVMGHVDHGKTSLLDALRRTSVAAGEAGGITQHIGAFTVVMPDSGAALTFLDTPGHAAFSAMRARGAAVTDVVVLVVAAEDGVMPQTREALAHARSAGCPIVVAITKCDLPSADVLRVKHQLLADGVELEEFGGTVQVVETAATAGVGLAELEEAILLQAEMMELKASTSRDAEAVVVEARMDKGQGPVATIVSKRGTLRVGQSVVVGCEWGKVRALRGPNGATLKELLPGQPAEITGLRGLPDAGDTLMQVVSEERAQRISKARTARAEDFRLARIAAAAAKMAARDAEADAAAEAAGGGEGGGLDRRLLTLVIKADVQGSAEAVSQAVMQLSSDKVRIKVVYSGIGPVTASDVALASAADASILAFNVKPAAPAVEAQAKQCAVTTCTQRVIYHLLDEVAELMAGHAPRIQEQHDVGSAAVLQVFTLKKGSKEGAGGVVAGCRVSEGSLKSGATFRVQRAGVVIHEGPAASIKRSKLEVQTVGFGTECGVILEGFNDVLPGDVLLCLTVESRAAKPQDVTSKPKQLYTAAA